MAFLTAEMLDGVADLVVFASVWEKVSADLRPGKMVIGAVRPNDRGLQLLSVHPV
jgi:hypothetical protein